jgi:Holliday junction DNA helicase RuvB
MIDSGLDQNPVADDTENSDEIVLETTLRPSTLDEFVGQEGLKSNLHIVIEAAKQRRDQLEHVLLYGPPGLGKTTLAYIIGRQMSSNVKTTSGPAIERAGDLASLLTNLQDGDILFIDEIHRLNKAVEEVLYPAMEDGVLDIMIGKGPGARSLRMDLPKFTIIGATTRIGMISAPLRDRFGLVYHLEYYEPNELQQIIERSGKLLNATLNNDASLELGKRSRFTPRIANRLLKRVRDYAQVHSHDTITLDVAREALQLLGIDELGLDSRDRKIIEVLIEKFNGGPAGLSTLAAATGEEQDTVTDVHEPFLIRQGLLARTPKGRVATDHAWRHIGKTPPTETQQTIL